MEFAWLVSALPAGELMEVLLAVVMAARQHLGLRVVLVADGACDFTLKILHSFLNSILSFSHDSSIS